MGRPFDLGWAYYFGKLFVVGNFGRIMETCFWELVDHHPYFVEFVEKKKKKKKRMNTRGIENVK